MEEVPGATDVQLKSPSPKKAKKRKKGVNKMSNNISAEVTPTNFPPIEARVVGKTELEGEEQERLLKERQLWEAEEKARRKQTIAALGLQLVHVVVSNNDPGPGDDEESYYVCTENKFC
jgi:hypothetical protein